MSMQNLLSTVYGKVH